MFDDLTHIGSYFFTFVLEEILNILEVVKCSTLENLCSALFQVIDEQVLEFLRQFGIGSTGHIAIGLGIG